MIIPSENNDSFFLVCYLAEPITEEYFCHFQTHYKFFRIGQKRDIFWNDCQSAPDNQTIVHSYCQGGNKWASSVFDGGQNFIRVIAELQYCPPLNTADAH